MKTHVCVTKNWWNRQLWLEGQTVDVGDGVYVPRHFEQVGGSDEEDSDQPARRGRRPKIAAEE